MLRVDQVFNLLSKRQSIFFSGPGGTGKSWTIREVVKKLIDTNLQVALTASTGVAALNISGGKLLPSTTLHSWAGIELATDTAEYYIQMIRKKPKRLKSWQDTDILIIDEIGMLGAKVFNLLDTIGRNVRRGGLNTPFGGLTLLVSGDFLQLPPVNDKWIFESTSWNSLKFKYFIFEEPKRYDDTEYFELLLRIRKAIPYEEDIEELEKRVVEYDKMMKLEQVGKGPEIKPTILYSRKIDVAGYNNQKLSELPGYPKFIVAEDSMKPYTSGANYDFYQSMLDEKSPRNIALKVGAQVMLTFNIDVQAGLANGSRGVVKYIEDDAIGVKFISAGERRITKITFEYEDQNGKASRKQFPFILAWALTIHKCQGATLESAVLDLGPSVFSAGGAYVALSRVKNLKGVYLSNFATSSIKASKLALAYTETISQEAEKEEEIAFVPGTYFDNDEELEIDDFNPAPSRVKKPLKSIPNFYDKDIIQSDS